MSQDHQRSSDDYRLPKPVAVTNAQFVSDAIAFSYGYTHPATDTNGIPNTYTSPNAIPNAYRVTHPNAAALR
jgi:hypothetical protein